ncbi:hypothetical protein GRI58_01075 [Porphyrobacter algicida]|uniref:17 kDa surface antigen n=1 Tax=Qipengyuania algicida TaxID=1836209 RepID=A0A845AAJ0_9SPHN|nr:hypothetical protein [Qipengyuania algicida]MXP27412.1 hypothetical protein [Qipengyuania algicida]
MNTITKALAGTIAAGAMAMTAAAPASARDYYHRDRDGISAGEVIAGVAILGGIAAIAASAGNNRDRYDARYYRDGRYGYYNGNPRDAVAQCVNAVRINAQRYGYRYANVTQIRDVDDTRGGWKVKGRIEVGGNNGYYGRQGYYDRGYYGNGYDNRGYYNRADTGSFTCYTDRGRVANIDYHGIRGL